MKRKKVKVKLSVEEKEKKRFTWVSQILANSEWLKDNQAKWPAGPLRIVNYENSLYDLEHDEVYFEQFGYTMSNEYRTVLKKYLSDTKEV